MHYRIASAQQHSGPVPSLGDTVTVESDVGPLYIRQDDTIIKPYLEEHGNWAPEQALTVRETVGSGMCFLDIGAHVGYFSVLAGALVGPDGVVFAFEPHPRNYELLLANVWRNGLTNVVCFPWAVGDPNGFAKLFEASGNGGDHQLYHSEGEQRSAVAGVRCVALDALVAISPPVDFVKIDIQGAEEGAMRGMEQLLTSSPNATIALEYWPYGMARFWNRCPSGASLLPRARVRDTGTSSRPRSAGRASQTTRSSVSATSGTASAMPTSFFAASGTTKLPPKPESRRLDLASWQCAEVQVVAASITWSVQRCPLLLVREEPAPRIRA